MRHLEIVIIVGKENGSEGDYVMLLSKILTIIKEINENMLSDSMYKN